MSTLRRDLGRTTYVLEVDGEASRMPEFKFMVEARHAAFYAIDQGASRVVVIRVTGDDEVLAFQPLYTITTPEASA